MPVQGLGPAAFGEREEGMGQSAERAQASGEPAEPAQRKIRRRTCPKYAEDGGEPGAAEHIS